MIKRVIGAVIAVLFIMAAGCLPPDVKSEPLRDPLFSDAERLFLEGRYDAAATILDRFLASGRDGRAYLLRGRCRLMSGDPGRAREDLEQARSAAPDLEVYIQATLGLADAAYTDRDYGTAIAMYGELLDAYRSRVPADVVMFRCAHSLVRSGSTARGRRMLEQVQLDFPGTSAAREAAEQLGDATGRFFVQAGAFTRRDNAEGLEAALMRDGFESLLIEEPGRVVVIIGYFDDMEAASAMLERLKIAGYAGVFIRP